MDSRPTLGDLGLKACRMLRDKGVVALRLAQKNLGDWTPRGVEAVDAGGTLPQEFLARYKMHKLLGTGATSTVHLCRLRSREPLMPCGLDATDDDPKEEDGFRAVKICRRRPRWREGSDAHFDELRKEIAVLRRLDHPNVLKSFEDYESPRHYLFVMEFAAGGELFERLATVGQFSERTAASLVKDIANGLKHCHTHGVIHRDMKLENLLLPAPALANVKLADFGMAHGARGITTTLCGTPGFLAPEQRYQLPYTSKVDLWGLGCVLYIMLSGSEPFSTRLDEQAFDDPGAQPSKRRMSRAIHEYADEDQALRRTSVKMAEFAAEDGIDLRVEFPQRYWSDRSLRAARTPKVQGSPI